MWRVKRLLLRGGGTLEALLKPILNGKHSGFTLAEMMVVMLILSIVLAAMAPVVTTRSKVDQSSPWKYSEGNLSDAYYGLGESQTAMIGQREFTATDETAKLIINSSSTRPSQIAFKRDGVNQGVLRLENSTTLLGSLSNGTTMGSNSIAIGKDTTSSSTYTIALGSGAKATGSNSVSIGQNSEAQFLSVALGNSAKANSTSGGSSAVGVAVGSHAKSTNTAAISIGSEATASGINSISMGQQSQASASETIAMGYDSVASGDYSIAIGMAAKSPDANSITIGKEAETTSDSIAIGYKSSAKDSSNTFGYNSYAYEYSTAIGNNSYATYNSVAIGYNAKANPSDAWAIAIGPGATAPNAGGIAIGDSTAQSGSAIAIGSAEAKGSSGIAMGFYAKANGTNNIALGNRACQHVTGSNKICIGANSGPISSSSQRSDDIERIYIGSSGTFQPPQKTSDRGGSVSSVEYNAPLEIHKSGNDAVVILNSNLIVRGNIWFLARKYDRFGAIYQAYGSDYVNVDTGTSAPSPESWSDRRLKYVGKEFTSGLDKIRALKVFNYTFKKDETKEPRVGVMAQDLQKIFPDAVKKGEDGFLRIRMEDMFYAVINAIKELDAKVAAQDKKIKELDAKITAQDKKIKELGLLIEKLEAQAK